MKYLFFLFPFLIITGHSFAQIIYVKKGETGTGTSWQDAAGDLQMVLQRAASGDQIWVCQGIYTPTQCTSCSYDDRNTSFVIPDSVEVYGGFAGVENSLSERDFSEMKTVLSGDIDSDGAPENNAFTIVYFKNVSGSTILDGFTIAAGNANQPSAFGLPQNSGGAIFNSGQLAGFSSSPLIRNCVLENNYALGFGGAVYNDGSFSGLASAVFQNCIFRNNFSGAGGGAVYCNASFSGICEPVFDDCGWTENYSESGEGGAMFNNGAEDGRAIPVINRARFENNRAYTYGGAIFNFGKTGSCTPLISNSFFIENTAKEGGAVYNDGSFGGEATATISNSDFENNYAEVDGGAIYNSGVENGRCFSKLEKCGFDMNRCGVAGAAIFNNGYKGDCEPEIKNCSFIKNQTQNYGGAIYNLGNEGLCNPKILNSIFISNRAYSAGALYNLGSNGGNSSPFIINCTFFGNRAEVGGAVYCNASDTTGTSRPLISNCIFYKNFANTGAVIRNIYGLPKIEFSFFDLNNCDELNSGVGGDVDCGAGLIFDQQLLFKDTANLDFHLDQNAMVIDRGDNAQISAHQIQNDLDGGVRIINNTVDYGAFEFGNNPGLPPQIDTQPLPRLVCENEEVEFFVSATGIGPFDFKWKKDGDLIPGADESRFQIPTVTIDDEGDYVCVVSNNAGLTESAAARLEVKTRVMPVIEIFGPDSTICIKDTVAFTAILENEGTNPQTTWRLNGETILENSVLLSVTGLEDGARINCQLVSSERCVFENPVLSNDIEVDVDSCLVGIFEKKILDDAISVFPNPAAESIYILFKKECSDCEITIEDLLGRKQIIEHEGGFWEGKIPVDITGFYPGCMVVRITKRGKTLALRKIITQ